MTKMSLIPLLILIAQDVLAQPVVADLYERSVPSVVQIVTYDATGSESALGSGFFVAAGRILTNAHVVADAYSAAVLSWDTCYLEVTILKMDENSDLALLQVRGGAEPALTLDSMAAYRPGDRVFAIGSPLGLQYSFSDGMISAIRGQPSGFQFIQTTAPTSPGSSGGPLLDGNGIVLGITSASAEDGQNVNFAVSSNSIRRFLAQPDYARVLPLASTSVWWRVAVKWVLRIVGVVIAFLFGPGWWLLAILVVLGYWIFLLFAWFFRLVTRPFRNE
jgi:S1-C subfamily serine protease